MSAAERAIGTWTLPSGNSVDVFVTRTELAGRRRWVMEFRWDEPPSPAWSEADVTAYRVEVRPAVMRAVAVALDVPLHKVLLAEV